MTLKQRWRHGQFNWDVAIGLAMSAVSAAGVVILIVWTIQAIIRSFS